MVVVMSMHNCDNSAKTTASETTVAAAACTHDANWASFQPTFASSFSFSYYYTMAGSVFQALCIRPLFVCSLSGTVCLPVYVLQCCVTSLINEMSIIWLEVGQSWLNRKERERELLNVTSFQFSIYRPSLSLTLITHLPSSLQLFFLFLLLLLLHWSSSFVRLV